MTPSDDSRVHSGVLAAGSRSNSVFAMAGNQRRGAANRQDSSPTIWRRRAGRSGSGPELGNGCRARLSRRHAARAARRTRRPGPDPDNPARQAEPIRVAVADVFARPGRAVAVVWETMTLPHRRIRKVTPPTTPPSAALWTWRCRPATAP